MQVFETFRPAIAQLNDYVAYYYLDLKPENQELKFECYPHYNNTISLNRSHIHPGIGSTIYKSMEMSRQIFTPIRQRPMTISQKGVVNRIVIVFKPFGINHFFRELDISKICQHIEFFDQEELDELFSTIDTKKIGLLIDQFLLRRFQPISQPMIVSVIDKIINSTQEFTIAQLAESIGTSRQHICRKFKQYLGIPIKKFQQIVIFRKALSAKLYAKDCTTFTQSAYQFGFSDKSHFNHTFKGLTNTSPRNFFRNGTRLGSEDTFWNILE